MGKSPNMHEPDGREPVRLPIEDCSYEVLKNHLDEALGSDPAFLEDLRDLLLAVYQFADVAEITLTQREEDDYFRAAICAEADRTVDERLGK